ncbi:MAG: Co2+/Mg2+ efflux protein ApaG [Leptospiraceae bacterium]|nr:Co2+/Mg2+ efflux protein ApaG [Leptospiraceae bacterium]
MDRISNATTRGILIKAVSHFVPEKSNPVQPLYFFSYDITITNEGRDAARLISRHWRIRDAYGRVEEVRGPGVIGQQPRLEPGQSFTYTSFCPLPTDFGIMQGTYQMRYDSGESFDAEIAPFQLIAPQAVN